MAATDAVRQLIANLLVLAVVVVGVRACVDVPVRVRGGGATREGTPSQQGVGAIALHYMTAAQKKPTSCLVVFALSSWQAFMFDSM